LRIGRELCVVELSKKLSSGLGKKPHEDLPEKQSSQLEERQRANLEFLLQIAIGTKTTQPKIQIMKRHSARGSLLWSRSSWVAILIKGSPLAHCQESSSIIGKRISETKSLQDLQESGRGDEVRVTRKRLNQIVEILFGGLVTLLFGLREAERERETVSGSRVKEEEGPGA
jgi:hypothetical protein